MQLAPPTRVSERLTLPAHQEQAAIYGVTRRVMKDVKYLPSPFLISSLPLPSLTSCLSDGAYCVWEVWGNLESSCAGNFTPSPPSRRLLSADGIQGETFGHSAGEEMSLKRIEANGRTCAFHALCSACSSGEVDDKSSAGNLAHCKEVFEMFYVENSDWYGGANNAAAALEPKVFQSWCEYYGYHYTQKLS